MTSVERNFNKQEKDSTEMRKLNAMIARMQANEYRVAKLKGAVAAIQKNVEEAGVSESLNLDQASSLLDMEEELGEVQMESEEMMNLIQTVNHCEDSKDMSRKEMSLLLEAVAESLEKDSDYQSLMSENSQREAAAGGSQAF